MPVEFACCSEDVYEALAQLDLLLVPSAAQEATTRVILEAYAAGVPVVAMARGGIPEVVDSGRDGFLAQSVDEMAQQAIDALKRPDDGLAERARETWRARFTLERYRCEMISVLRRISS